MKYGLPELLLLKGFHAQVDKSKCTRGHNLIDLTPSQTPEANGATLSTCPRLHPPSPHSLPLPLDYLETNTSSLISFINTSVGISSR